MSSNPPTNAVIAEITKMALDWADSRAVDLRVEPAEDGQGLDFVFDDELEVTWHFSGETADEDIEHAEDGLWQFLDEYLQDHRPAGTRCWPFGIIDDFEISDALESSGDGVLDAEIFRIGAREVRMHVVDNVTLDEFDLEFTWTRDTTSAQFLDMLCAPLATRVANYRARRLTDTELTVLEHYSGLARAALDTSPFLLTRLRRQGSLEFFTRQARCGDLHAHSQLRRFMDHTGARAPAVLRLVGKA
jgi:hypothetical protein